MIWKFLVISVPFPIILSDTLNKIHHSQLHHLFFFLVQEAEQMHMKAIAIKEKLLGEEDYEVALSVGHLASLYNYDMMLYSQAENLYLRSIDIGK